MTGSPKIKDSKLLPLGGSGEENAHIHVYVTLADPPRKFYKLSLG